MPIKNAPERLSRLPIQRLRATRNFRQLLRDCRLAGGVEL